MLSLSLFSLLWISGNSSKFGIKRIITFAIFMFFIITWFSFENLTWFYYNPSISIFNQFFVINFYTYFVIILFLIITIIYLFLLWVVSLPRSTELIFFLVFHIFSLAMLVLSDNFIVIFTIIELQSYVVYILVVLLQNKTPAINIWRTKSGLIYFFIGTLASLFLLFGFTILYFATGSMNMSEVYYILQQNHDYNYITIAFILSTFGLFLKLGCFPLHQWLIDIYANIPTVFTLWISLLPKIGILYLVLNFYTHLDIFHHETNIIQWFAFIAIISIAGGSCGGLWQFSIKRVLAFSGLANIGYILLIILANNDISYFTFSFYILQYSLTHVLIFIIIILVVKNYKYFISSTNKIKNYQELINTSVMIQDFHYLRELNPMMCSMYILALASFMGIPPLLGFYAKFHLINSVLISQFWFNLVVIVVMSIVAAYFYGNLIASTYVDHIKEIRVKIISSGYLLRWLVSFLSIIIGISYPILEIYRDNLLLLVSLW